MRVRGNILLVLLVMLLLACAALLQLSEDNYLAHLIGKHVEDLSSARKALNEGFKKLSFSQIPQACYGDAASCQIKISNMTVNYSLRKYQQEGQETSYLQYTLHIKVGMTSVGLYVVERQAPKTVVAWVYT